jgi:hypothetical protein
MRGLGCAFLFLGFAGSAAPAAQEIVWVADTAAGAVHLLDTSLAVFSTAKGLASPRAMSVDSEGGAWVACGGGAVGSRVVHVSPVGRASPATLAFAWVPDLAATAEGGVWVADRGAGTLVRLDAQGTFRRRLRVAGVACVEVVGAQVAAGTDGGEVIRGLDPLQAVSRSLVGGHVVDLRRGPIPGELWALDAAYPVRILRLGSDGGIRATAVLGFPAEHLATAGDEVWVAATNAGLVRRYGTHAQLVLELWLPVPGDPNFLESLRRDGSVLLPIGASIVRVGLDGFLLGVVGGFEGLSGIARGPFP